MSMNIMLMGAGGSGSGWGDGSSLGGSPTVYTFGNYVSYAWKTVGNNNVTIPSAKVCARMIRSMLAL